MICRGTSTSGPPRPRASCVRGSMDQPPASSSLSPMPTTTSRPAWDAIPFRGTVAGSQSPTKVSTCVAWRCPRASACTPTRTRRRDRTMAGAHSTQRRLGCCTPTRASFRCWTPTAETPSRTSTCRRASLSRTLTGHPMARALWSRYYMTNTARIPKSNIPASHAYR